MAAGPVSAVPVPGSSARHQRSITDQFVFSTDASWLSVLLNS
jgi:hypothetical protein